MQHHSTTGFTLNLPTNDGSPVPKKLKRKSPRSMKAKYSVKEEDGEPKKHHRNRNQEEGTADEVLVVSKQDNPSFVTESWLDRYRLLIKENTLSWSYPYKKQVQQYYAPLEHLEDMDLLLSSDEGTNSISVCVELNGHVLRVYEGTVEEESPDILITFDLKEISVALSTNEGAKEKLVVMSRFHSRVFMFSLNSANPKYPMSEIFGLIQINMDWARKYSLLKYPDGLVSELWNEGKKYVLRSQFHGQASDKSLGMISYQGKSYQGTLSPADGKPGISLVEPSGNGEDKLRCKLSIGVSVLPKSDAEQGIVFFIVSGKSAFQMHDVAGLERLYINCNMDRYITAKYEAKILNLISRYAKFPVPIEYTHHKDHYKLLPQTVYEPLDSSRTALRFLDRIDSVAQTPRTTSHSSQFDAKKFETLQTSLETLMDKMTMVVGAVSDLQNHIDNVETMQTQMADIMDMESQRVQNVEQKMDTIQSSAVNKNDTMENLDLILDKLDYLELKVDDARQEVTKYTPLKDHDMLAQAERLYNNSTDGHDGQDQVPRVPNSRPADPQPSLAAADGPNE
eukprot:TRINITY_DN18846_c0_g1_i1.p1 TRINITY_DN18846_c0_g1~~TRINITY_DN18846_c0_g1_i1.p1  ORF type:complete len:566 (+),score=110.14 TRINITY_DN18846_c0_g1_i1:40-1737(+)